MICVILSRWGDLVRKIEKERLWVYSPVTQVVFEADYLGCNEGQLIQSIDKAVNCYEALKSKVMIDKEGRAWFVPIEQANYSIQQDDRVAEEMICEQEKKPFDIWKGEYIRFFYRLMEDRIRLTVIAHHIIGDGLSFAYFLESILVSLTGKQLELIPAKEISIKQINEQSKLSLPLRIMERHFNKKWKKYEKIFSISEYEEMARQYWQTHESMVVSKCINNKAYEQLIAYSKKVDVTVNTLIITAFLEADQVDTDCGIAISLREAEDPSMGNYAIGASMHYKYDGAIGFRRNAENVQKLIYKQLKDKSKKFFLLNFMGNMEGTLLDAVYFAACGGYENPLANQYAKMFGYMGNPKGLSVTNLKVLPIKTEIGEYRVQNIRFIPPLVLNLKNIVGVASANDALSITLHLDAKKEVNRSLEIFENAIKRLRSF